MKLTVKVRKADISDAPAIARLSCQLGYPTTTSLSSIRLAHLLNNKDHAVMVAVSEPDQVVGWIHVSSTPRIETDPFAEIGGLVVDETQRCLGIGKLLLVSSLIWAKDNGFHTLRVRSNIIRAGAHRFYQREGFQVTKTQVVFEIDPQNTPNEDKG
jgi:ribosomal protein S18 acetylase RimI-like enzyme